MNRNGRQPVDERWVNRRVIKIRAEPVGGVGAAKEIRPAIVVKAQVRGQPADSLKQLTGWIRLPSSGERSRVRLLCYRLPEEQAKKARERKAASGNSQKQELSEGS